VCVLSGSGEILAEEVLPNTRECLAAYAARYPGATIIMETDTQTSCPTESWRFDSLTRNLREQLY